MEELVEWSVVTEGGLGGYSPMACVVCWIQACVSMGRTGSVRGIVKYPFGFGSQHLATTNLIGPGF